MKQKTKNLKRITTTESVIRLSFKKSDKIYGLQSYQGKGSSLPNPSYKNAIKISLPKACPCMLTIKSLHEV